MARKKSELVGGTVKIGDVGRPIVASTDGRWAGEPTGYAAILAPFADLAHPIQPEPALTDEQQAAIGAAIEQMRDPDAQPIAVELDGVDLIACARALRMTARRMGLALTFYTRAAVAAIEPSTSPRGVVQHGRPRVSAALIVARLMP